jgi:DNA-binding transcriptional MerR regulator
MEKWLSMKELVKSTTYAETTIRRYLSLFQEFVVSQEFGKHKKYSPDVVELIKEIAEMYDLGKNTEEIRSVLRLDRKQTYDITTLDVDTQQIEPAPRNQIETLLSQNQVVVDSLRELVTTQRNEIEHLKQGMETMQRELEELKQTKLPQNKVWWKFW